MSKETFRNLGVDMAKPSIPEVEPTKRAVPDISFPLPTRKTPSTPEPSPIRTPVPTREPVPA